MARVPTNNLQPANIVPLPPLKRSNSVSGGRVLKPPDLGGSKVCGPLGSGPGIVIGSQLHQPKPRKYPESMMKCYAVVNCPAFTPARRYVSGYVN